MRAPMPDVAGFQNLTREELVSLNGGGWGFWKVIGMVAAGWAKIFVAVGIFLEVMVGAGWAAGDDLDYWWGDAAT